MTHRLLVNPGTPSAWEIALRPGPNRIGRGDHNDFKVQHASVSGTHCEITVSSAGVLIKDLGSTNGTFLNGAPVNEAMLHSGQHLQFGAVDMVFESAAPEGTPPVRVNLPAAAAASAPARVTTPAGGMRFSGAHATPAAAPAVAPVETQSGIEPPMAPPIPPPASAGPAYCKFHPKTLARFYCNKCRKYFCDMCVTTHATSTGQKKICRACGADVTPVLVKRAVTSGQGFYARLPGAFIYPLRGFGPVILLLAALVFSALNFLGRLPLFVGIMGIVLRIIMLAAAYGFLFRFMQNIIHVSTSDENEPLSLPAADGLLIGFMQLLGTLLMSFWLQIGLEIVQRFTGFSGIQIPGAAFIAATILGCLYCPMAILAVTMKDSVLAGNPLVVFPAILRMPLEYAVTAIVLLSAYGFYQLGSRIAMLAGWTTMTTHNMSVMFMSLGFQALWSFITIYILAVSMRILAMLYVSKKERFGWFTH